MNQALTNTASFPLEVFGRISRVSARVFKAWGRGSVFSGTSGTRSRVGGAHFAASAPLHGFGQALRDRRNAQLRALHEELAQMRRAGELAKLAAAKFWRSPLRALKTLVFDIRMVDRPADLDAVDILDHLAGSPTAFLTVVEPALRARLAMGKRAVAEAEAGLGATRMLLRVLRWTNRPQRSAGEIAAVELQLSEQQALLDTLRASLWRREQAVAAGDILAENAREHLPGVFKAVFHGWEQAVAAADALVADLPSGDSNRSGNSGIFAQIMKTSAEMARPSGLS